MRQNRRDERDVGDRTAFTGEGSHGPFRERKGSYQRFKRRIIHRLNSDGPSASTPVAARWRRRAGCESDSVRHRLELDSPPGPSQLGMTWRNPRGSGGESASTNVNSSHTFDTRRRLPTRNNAKQKRLRGAAALHHTNAAGTGGCEDRCDLKPFAVVDQKWPKTLAAPKLIDDYYSSLLDCSCDGTVALALGSCAYIWNAETNAVVGRLEPATGRESISCLCWSADGRALCVGTRRGEMQLWDVECRRMTRFLQPHLSMVRAVSWKQDLLSSGSALGRILHHDLRAASPVGSLVQEEGLCSLQWSPDGGRLAGGSADGLLSVWDSGTAGCTGTRWPVTSMKQPGAVKAMGWCPWQRNSIATGGGHKDGKLRIWDAASGTCEASASTDSQICSLRWAEKKRGLLTGHGRPRHHIACWSWDFPSLSLSSQLTGHCLRVLHVALNPGNTQLFSAGADQRFRIWDI